MKMRTSLLAGAALFLLTLPAYATLPSSGTITFAEIKAEFGGSNNFTDYYGGGPYVASGLVPSSGALGFSDFYGKSAFTGFTDTYDSPGSYTVGVPTGATGLTIKVYGGGGTGNPGGGNPDDGFYNGAGGGTGARVVWSVTLAGGDASRVISFTVGGTDESSTCSASLIHGTPSLTAHPGNVGGLEGTGGTGGTASGGNVSNDTGNTGNASAGFPTDGIDEIGGGGQGGTDGVGNTNGDPGRVQFIWT